MPGRAASNWQQPSFATTSRLRCPSPFSELFCQLQAVSSGPHSRAFPLAQHGCPHSCCIDTVKVLGFESASIQERAKARLPRRSDRRAARQKRQEITYLGSMIVTATILASDSESVLDRVTQGGEVVEVQRHGRIVAEIRPRVGASRSELLRLLRGRGFSQADSRHCSRQWMPLPRSLVMPVAIDTSVLISAEKQEDFDALLPQGEEGPYYIPALAASSFWFGRRFAETRFPGESSCGIAAATVRLPAPELLTPTSAWANAPAPTSCASTRPKPPPVPDAQMLWRARNAPNNSPRVKPAATWTDDFASAGSRNRLRGHQRLVLSLQRPNPDVAEADRTIVPAQARRPLLTFCLYSGKMRWPVSPRISSLRCASRPLWNIVTRAGCASLPLSNTGAVNTMSKVCHSPGGRHVHQRRHLSVNGGRLAVGVNLLRPGIENLNFIEAQEDTPLLPRLCHGPLGGLGAIHSRWIWQLPKLSLVVRLWRPQLRSAVHHFALRRLPLRKVLAIKEHHGVGRRRGGGDAGPGLMRLGAGRSGHAHGSRTTAAAACRCKCTPEPSLA